MFQLCIVFQWFTFVHCFVQLLYVSDRFLFALCLWYVSVSHPYCVCLLFFFFFCSLVRQHNDGAVVLAFSLARLAYFSSQQALSSTKHLLTLVFVTYARSYFCRDAFLNDKHIQPPTHTHKINNNAASRRNYEYVRYSAKK